MKAADKIILISGGFAGGFITGYAVTLYKSSDAFRAQRKRIETIIERFSNALKESQERLSEVNSRLRRELKDPIPDLYRATESLSLDESELIYD